MDKQSGKTGRGQNTRRGGSDPTVPRNRGPGPCGLRGSLPPRAALNRSSCFGRAQRRTDEFADNEV